MTHLFKPLDIYVLACSLKDWWLLKVGLQVGDKHGMRIIWGLIKNIDLQGLILICCLSKRSTVELGNLFCCFLTNSSSGSVPEPELDTAALDIVRK